VDDGDDDPGAQDALAVQGGGADQVVVEVVVGRQHAGLAGDLPGAPDLDVAGGGHRLRLDRHRRVDPDVLAHAGDVCPRLDAGDGRDRQGDGEAGDVGELLVDPGAGDLPDRGGHPGTALVALDH